MKKKLLISLCLLTCFAVSTNAFELNNSKFKGKIKNAGSIIKATSKTTAKNTTSTVQTTALKTQIKALNLKMASADKSAQEAFSTLISAISPDSYAKNIKAEITKINNNAKLTAAEKNAKISAIMLDYNAKLKTQQKSIINELKSTPESKKAEIKKAVAEITKSTTQYALNTAQANTLMSKINSDSKTSKALNSEYQQLKTTVYNTKKNIEILKQLSTNTLNLYKI